MPTKIILSLLVILAVSIASCTTARLPVPPAFSSQSSKMHVKGLNGWMVNQHLSFGNYSTSTIKRGWDFSSSVQYTKFRLRPEEYLLTVFDINTDKNTNTHRNKFQYTLNDGTLEAEIYATEKFKEKQLVYKSNNPYIGSASKTTRYEYAFTAAIIPLTRTEPAAWSLVLLNKYDQSKDTARKIFDKPYVEEEGYATNGKENIAIRPLRIDEMVNAKGKKTRILGGKMLSGYELQWNGRAVCLIDILDNNIWIANSLQPAEKLIVSSVSSAILLKRMQDISKDADKFDQDQ